MGRQVRKVPKNWSHPVNENSHFIPLSDGVYEDRIAEWNLEKQKWDEGYVYNFLNDTWKPKTDHHQGTYEEYVGTPAPVPEAYMPVWDESECTCFMMYETVTNGTPISPAFETAEELARWLEETGAPWFADQTASYVDWLDLIVSGDESLSIHKASDFTRIAP